MSDGRILIAIGAISGALAVVAGAFAAHGLTQVLDPDGVRVFRTGAEYQLLHSVVVCVAGVWLRAEAGARAVEIGAWALLAGIVLFSGSLYVLAFGGPSWLGPVTPLGGLAFIAGWLCLAAAALRR